MATATVSVDLGIKSETSNYQVFSASTPEGKVDPKTITVTSREKAQSALAEDKTVELAISQPFKIYSVSSDAAFLELIPDQETRVSLYNAAIGAKTNAKINSALKEIGENGEFTFEPVEGVYDTIDWLREAPKRTFMSPEEKALKLLGNLGLSADALSTLLAKLQSQQTED